MDPRVFVLICLAAASRHQPSPVLEVDPNDPQDDAFNETDFQRLRDATNSGDSLRIVGRDWEKANDPQNKSYNETDFQELRGRRWVLAQAKMWPSFLKAHPEEGWHLFEKLAADEHEWVRGAATKSPAWPILLETRNAEAWHLFEQLATDKHGLVRVETAESPAWPDVVKSNLWEAWRVFAKLMSDQELRIPELFQSPAWKAFGAAPRTALEEHLNSSTPANLQDIAGSLQKVADNGFTHNVKDLPFVKGLAATLRRSSDETWLGEMAKMSLFAGDAALRASLAENV